VLWDDYPLIVVPPQNSYIEVPGLSDTTWPYLGTWSYRGQQVKMRSLGWTLERLQSVLRRGDLQTSMYWWSMGGCHVDMNERPSTAWKGDLGLILSHSPHKEPTPGLAQ
jgi:hypothetical protein